MDAGPTGADAEEKQMEARTTRLRTTSDAGATAVRAVPLLLLLISVAAGAAVMLAFQQWVDFGITEIRGTDADAATGFGDGWAVAGLGCAIVLLAGGVIFTPRYAPVFLPVIAVAAVCMFAIAGFDTVTNWHASGVDPENQGVFVQTDGDPTVAPYAVAALAVVIALSAAVVRGIQLRERPP
jgi:hypothetical protein